ncbi:predicted protein [Phaeodactylum tricornutum CCAP 1055/1]|jgi:hypothetical protein|uniref:Glyoxalase/fosfomycin resistance/dioxygenase domain-containing protein n=1 Tax=Phaeodactylum tricornutum (strain CCAP 1055/1) TaxID=556484 RepID=B5Y5W9_PHATC|nr:predicted protein [Phaeodactylum tricornutum CCAP 1055/1]ACI65454.1 predicted protein [Phaeodactylum tricornutum CCAP 1055/1]|eukprot:XP_002185984.1 predicted protein [Phaeodactylum tricornutum CCAP 1055/1]
MSVISHISIGSTKEKFGEMVRFYDSVMTTVGAKRQMVYSTDGERLDVQGECDPEKLAAIAYGKYWPEIWIQLPHDKKEATVGNGAHISFACRNSSHVQHVYDTAITNGGTCNGKPGPRKEYSDKYYGAFFLDPCGNKLEATFFDLGLWNYCGIL